MMRPQNSMVNENRAYKARANMNQEVNEKKKAMENIKTMIQRNMMKY